MITGGYRLPATSLIHPVGPVWRGGGRGEAELLRGCYRNCMHLATESGLKQLAFPAISTGVCGFPKRGAARGRTRRRCTTTARMVRYERVRNVNRLFACTCQSGSHADEARMRTVLTGVHAPGFRSANLPSRRPNSSSCSGAYQYSGPNRFRNSHTQERILSTLPGERRYSGARTRYRFASEPVATE